MLDKFKDIKAETRRIRENLELKESVRFLKRDVKFLNFFFWFMVTCTGLLFYLLFTVDSYSPDLLSQSPPNISIDYSELNEEEKLIAKSIIGEMKLLYLKPLKSIKFTHDLGQYYTGDIELEKLVGFYRDRDVFIKYTGDVKQMKRTLGHESLHGVLRHGDISHDIIYELSEDCPAFKGGCG